MKRLLAALACIAFAAFAGRALPACDPGGIGGTGISDSGGIGGTGLRAETELGVYGVITGFASICVNGLELHYDAKTTVSRNAEPVQADTLALGQVVLVRAQVGEKQARARAIDIVDAAVGPAEGTGERIRVGGQPVRIEPATILGGGLARGELAGRTLRVSGLQAADGAIVATRVDPAPPRAAPAAQVADLGAGRFSVQGYVSDAQQDLRIGGMSFEAPGTIRSQLERDRLVRVTGRVEAGRRVVEGAELLSRPLNPRPERTLRSEPRSGREPADARGSSGGGRSGRESAERPERVDRSGPGGGDRPDRVDRSGRH